MATEKKDAKVEDMKPHWGAEVQGEHKNIIWPCYQERNL